MDVGIDNAFTKITDSAPASAIHMGASGLHCHFGQMNFLQSRCIRFPCFCPGPMHAALNLKFAISAVEVREKRAPAFRKQTEK
jgi:hypothetical protein